MSKFILSLFLLFNIYICEVPKNIRVFDSRKDMDKLIKIRPGEEFKLKLFKPASLFSWFLLNQNETQKYFQLLEHFESFEGKLRSAAGARFYSYFHFKALKKTKEDIILKFGMNIRFSNGENTQSVKTIKINVE